MIPLGTFVKIKKDSKWRKPEENKPYGFIVKYNGRYAIMFKYNPPVPPEHDWHGKGFTWGESAWYWEDELEVIEPPLTTFTMEEVLEMVR